MDRLGVTVAVAVLLVAGCNGLGGTSDGANRGTETLTPAPVTETGSPEADVRAASLPPGIGENGSVSVQTLLLAHRTYLDDRSYTWVLSLNRTDLSANTVVDNYTKRVAVENDSRYLLTVRHRTSGTTRLLFVDGTEGYLRRVSGNFTTSRFLPRPVDAGDAITAEQRVENALAVTSSEIERIQRNGRTYYRLYVRSAPRTRLDDHPKSVLRNFSATAYVTPEGFVRSLAVEYELKYTAQWTRVAYRFDYRKVGRTSVPIPDWAARQRALYNDTGGVGQPTPTPERTVTPAETRTPASPATSTPVTTASGTVAGALAPHAPT